MSFDMSMQVGFYDAFGQPVAQHSYAIGAQHGTGTLFAFPSFGGFALGPGDRGHKGVVYPARMWTPRMIGSQPVGIRLPSSLYMALGMGQFRVDPSYLYKVSDWDENRAPDKCEAGLTYAINGVCHQACNRVMWATRMSNFTDCPVNWPDSFSASYWVYGYYGKLTEDVAVNLARRLAARAFPEGQFDVAAKGPPVPEEALPMARAATNELRELNGKALRGYLAGHVSREERQSEIDLMLSVALASHQAEFDPTAMQGILTPDERFRKLKLDLDQQLIRGQVSNAEYAATVNKAFRAMTTELRNVLAADAFEKLFPEQAGGGHFDLVDPALMPVSYAATKALVGA